MYRDDDVVEFWENQRFWGLSWGVPLLPFDWPAFSDPQGNAVQIYRPPEREGERGWFIVRTLGTDEEGWRYSTVFSKLDTPRPGGRASKRSSDYVRSRVWRKLTVDPRPVIPDRELQAIASAPWGSGASTATGGGGGRGATRSHKLEGLESLLDTDNEADASASDAEPSAAAAGVAATGATAAAARRTAHRLHPEAERIILSAVAAAGIAQGGGGGGRSGGASQPKPSLFKLWQLFMELWNDACARHGMRRLVPLDPLGLYVAARRHRELLARQRRAQLVAGRLVAAAPMATEVEPDVLDARQDPAAAQQSAAAAGGLHEAAAAGVGSAAAAEAAVAAAAATAAATAAAHQSPAVGETPTGATIRQPAAPQPATVHRLGTSGTVWDPEFRTASVTQAPGRAAAAGGSGSGAAAGGGDDTQQLAADQGLMPDLDDPATLLSELITATNYARAAYGYVMAAGHLDSLTKLFTMLGSSAHFNPITGASAEANLEAIHLFTGIPVEDVVMAEWRSSVFRPCHYLAVDRRRRRLVLAVRGSLELADIATDLTARPVEFDFGDGLVGHVHQGLMSAASYVQLNTAAALRAAAERFPGWPLLVTGHSLGAGVAALLTLLLQRRPVHDTAAAHGATSQQPSPSGPGPGPGPDTDPPGRPLAAPAAVPAIHCLAIAPPAVLSANLAELARGCIVSVINQGDFVARLSCYSVDRALLELVQASPAAQMADTFLQSTGATLAAIQQRLAALGGGNGGGGGGGFGGPFDGFGFLRDSMGWRGGWPSSGDQPAGAAANLRGMEVEMVAPSGGGGAGRDWRGSGPRPVGHAGHQAHPHLGPHLAAPGQALGQSPPGLNGLKDIAVLASSRHQQQQQHPHHHHHHHHQHHHLNRIQNQGTQNLRGSPSQSSRDDSPHPQHHSQQRPRRHSNLQHQQRQHQQPQPEPPPGAMAVVAPADATDVLEAKPGQGGGSGGGQGGAEPAGGEHGLVEASAVPSPLQLTATTLASIRTSRGGGGGGAQGDEEEDDDDFSIVSAHSSGGEGPSESYMSYHSAASPHESYLSAASSPASRVSVSFEDALDAGFLYRAAHPNEYRAAVNSATIAASVGGSGGGGGGGPIATASGGGGGSMALPFSRLQAPSAVTSHPLSTDPSQIVRRPSGSESALSSGTTGSRGVQHHGSGGGRHAAHVTPAGLAAAAAAAAVGGVPYASGHPSRHSRPPTPQDLAAAPPPSAARAIPAPGAQRGHVLPPGDVSGAGQYAAMTPPATPSRPVPGRGVAAGGREGLFAAAAEGWGFGLFGGGGTPPAATPPPTVPPLGTRRSSDPLAGRRMLYRHAASEEEDEGDDEGDGMGLAGRRGGWGRIVGAGGSGGLDVAGRRRQGGGGGGDSLISWEALSRNLMTSWFGQGYFEDEDEEADQQQQQQGMQAERGRGADGGGGNGGGGGGFGSWWSAAMAGVAGVAGAAGQGAAGAAEAALRVASGGGGSRSGMTSFWPGLEEPPGPHSNQDTVLRGKYGAPDRLLSWPWPDAPQPPPLPLPRQPSRDALGAGPSNPGRGPMGASGAVAAAAAGTSAAAGGSAAAAGRPGGREAASGTGPAAAATPGRVVRHKHSLSAPLGEVLPEFLAAAPPPLPADALSDLHGTSAAGDPNGGSREGPVGRRGTAGGPGPSPARMDFAAAVVAEAAVRGGEGAAQVATAVAAAAPSMEAAVSGGAPVPHYIHAVHKELYPPGRLLWIIAEDEQTLPETMRGLVARGGFRVTAASPPAANDAVAGGANETRGSRVVSAGAAPGDPAMVAATTAPDPAVAESAAAAAAQAAPAPTVEVPGAGSRSHGSVARGTDGDLALASTSGSSSGGTRQAHLPPSGPSAGPPPLPPRPQSQPGSPAAEAEGEDGQSYSLLDLSLVTDLMQGLVSGPTLGAVPPAAATKPGALGAAPPAATAAAGVPRAPSSPPADTAAAAMAAQAGAVGPGPASGSKRPRVSFGGGDDGASSQDLQQQQQGSGPLAAAAGAAAAAMAAAASVLDAAGSPPLGVRQRSSFADAAADSGGLAGGSGGGGGDGSGSSTPFTARVREGLKRIKSGVETMLRQAPLPSVPSVAFLQGGGSSGGGTADGSTHDCSDSGADGGTAGAAGNGGGQGASQGQWLFMVEVTDREVFERMILNPASITDHLPDAYFQKLRQLAKGSAAAAVTEEEAAAAARGARAGGGEGRAGASGGSSTGR